MLTCLHKCLTSGSSPTALDMAADVILTLQVTASTCPGMQARRTSL